MILFNYNDVISVKSDYDESISKLVPELNCLPLHITSSSSENAIFIVQALAIHLIKKYNVIDDIYLSTFNINQDAVRFCEEICHIGNVSGSVNVLFSDSIKRMDEDKYNLIVDGLSSVPDMMFWSAVNNHSKMQLISGGGNFFVVEGSGNLASNSNSEQYTIFNNKQLFEFRRNIILSQFSDKDLQKSMSLNVSDKFNHIGN